MVPLNAPHLDLFAPFNAPALVRATLQPISTLHGHQGGQGPTVMHISVQEAEKKVPRTKASRH